MEPINSDEDNWLKSELKKRAAQLFGGLKITIDDYSLTEFIEKNHPDMRKIYVKIQDFHQKGITNIDINTVRQNSYSYAEL
jgi:pyruvate-formate lyase